MGVYVLWKSLVLVLGKLDPKGVKGLIWEMHQTKRVIKFLISKLEKFCLYEMPSSMTWYFLWKMTLSQLLLPLHLSLPVLLPPSLSHIPLSCPLHLSKHSFPLRCPLHPSISSTLLWLHQGHWAIFFKKPLLSILLMLRVKMNQMPVHSSPSVESSSMVQQPSTCPSTVPATGLIPGAIDRDNVGW